MMNFQKIKSLQKEYGYDTLQGLINNGTAWTREGRIGRAAMEALRSGICMLPKQHFFDAYGNRVPSRDELVEGTKGTFQNSQAFWQAVEDGEIYLSNAE